MLSRTPPRVRLQVRRKRDRPTNPANLLHSAVSCFCGKTNLISAALSAGRSRLQPMAAERGASVLQDWLQRHGAKLDGVQAQRSLAMGGHELELVATKVSAR